MARQTKRANNCPVPSGVLVIIGGAENKGEEKANGKQTPDDFKRLEVLKSLLNSQASSSLLLKLLQPLLLTRMRLLTITKKYLKS
jgi:hypothetical protein